jgi:hypothetical protein
MSNGPNLVNNQGWGNAITTIDDFLKAKNKRQATISGSNALGKENRLVMR